jgi:hypothetical protein
MSVIRSPGVGVSRPSQFPSFMPADVYRDWLAEPGHHDDMTSNTLQHLQTHLDSAIHLH